MTRERGPIRVVLDTNVVLSGIFFAGVPGRILDAWRAGGLTLVLSPAILAEYYRAGTALAARYPEFSRLGSSSTDTSTRRCASGNRRAPRRERGTRPPHALLVLRPGWENARLAIQR